MTVVYVGVGVDDSRACDEEGVGAGVLVTDVVGGCLLIVPDSDAPDVVGGVVAAPDGGVVGSPGTARGSTGAGAATGPPVEMHHVVSVDGKFPLRIKASNELQSSIFATSPSGSAFASSEGWVELFADIPCAQTMGSLTGIFAAGMLPSAWASSAHGSVPQFGCASQVTSSSPDQSDGKPYGFQII